MADRFRELLKTRDYIIFDGAMGTMLQAAGMKMGETPEVLNITRPELLVSIAEQYYNAGSDVVYANTFGANRYKLEECGKSVEELVTAGIVNAKKARDTVKPDGLVALDVGPIGQLLEPTGVLSFEEAYDMYAEIVKAGAAAGADLVVFETMTDLLDVKAAVLAAKENSDLPIVATMTFEQNMRTFTGCSISAMALTLTGLGVDALGVNCSLGPKELEPVIEELVKWTNLPIVVKPNAGLPDPETNLYNVTAAQFADFMKDLRKYGIKIFGGCCGTNPEFIKELSEMLKREGNPAALHKYIPGAVCSATSTVVVDEPRIIGERINPTGKKLFKEALLRHDMDYILGQALEQISGGADILDVNVGLPGIDEREMMIDTIKSLQAVVDVPLQIDSTIPEVLEAALRVYNGKPLVNSVNGEEESLNNVLPLVKKYGAGVIGLALDKDGIPKKAEDRVAIAKKIMDRAVAMGIPKEDIYIDCLTLTASAEQEGVMETLNALHTVKHELGLKTVLGVSNISFGLPNRVLVNHIFLTMALTNGLDLAIINPNIPEMTGAVRAYKLLANIDKNSVDYIKNYGAMPNVSKIDPVKKEKKDGNYTGDDLFYAVEKGLKNEGAEITEALLKIMDRAVAMGIPKEDIYIDCLTLTASAEQEGVMETLNALHTVKNKLGLKTVLGVSNISFGLPNRVLVNHIFLTMALTNGLDLAIINPNIPEMTGAVRAYKLLANIDKNSVDYIKNYGAMPNVSKIDPVKKEKKDGNYTGDDLFYAVEKGLKNEGAEITEALLKVMDSMEIVNQVLIPALDKIGAEFEKGTLFLPQLIMSAGVAQAAFEVIRKHMVMSDNAPVSKGKIVIATVKGDVHDIGKNIVKVLLENYGYDVIDLGKDVEYQAVVDAIRDNDVKLCGLSALMTTTLVSMKETIALIRENNLDCKVMVGGAVLTPEYAKEIDADFYAKDAKESVDIAKRVLG